MLFIKCILYLNFVSLKFIKRLCMNELVFGNLSHLKKVSRESNSSWPLFKWRYTSHIIISSHVSMYLIVIMNQWVQSAPTPCIPLERNSNLTWARSSGYWVILIMVTSASGACPGSWVLADTERRAVGYKYPGAESGEQSGLRPAAPVTAHCQLNMKPFSYLATSACLLSSGLAQEFLFSEVRGEL